MPEACGTEEEITVFKRLAKENNWVNVADVAFDTHYRSIRRFLPRDSKFNDVVTHAIDVFRS